MTRRDKSIQLLDAVNEAHQGEDLMIRCPAHDDGTESLHVSPAPGGGSVLLMCHAGCETEQIIRAVNIPWSALFTEDTRPPTDANWTPGGTASDVYRYRSDQGLLLYEVLRVPQPSGKKQFYQRRPTGDPEKPYIWKLDDVERVLYRLPQIIAAVAAGKTIYIPEGEKDVHTLVGLALEATCNSGGAGKWLPEYNAVLAGAHVVVISDNDNSGHAHARMVRDQLRSVGASVEIREAPAPHKDVTALIASGGSIDELLVTTPAEEVSRERFGIDVLDVIIRPVSETDWIIPGAFARKERCVFTGFEGQGKSQWLRQLAAQLAAGINPFTLEPMEPQRVLFIDGENEPNQTLASWRWLVELAQYHTETGIERGQLVLLEEWDNDSLDLSSPQGTAWLHERIHGYQPDVCILGPLTNMVGRDLKDDEPVRRLKNTINSARSICGTGFFMEHHAPHKSPTDKRRSIRPYGSSMFLKWPDYGYGLLPNPDKDEGHYDFARFRWPRVRSRGAKFPQALRWGREEVFEWPWVEDEDGSTAA